LHDLKKQFFYFSDGLNFAFRGEADIGWAGNPENVLLSVWAHQSIRYQGTAQVMKPKALFGVAAFTMACSLFAPVSQAAVVYSEGFDGGFASTNSNLLESPQ
jgi:hypothetical protein